MYVVYTCMHAYTHSDMQLTKTLPLEHMHGYKRKFCIKEIAKLVKAAAYRFYDFVMLCISISNPLCIFSIVHTHIYVATYL